MDPTTFKLLWNSTEMVKFRGSTPSNANKTLTFPADIQPGDVLVVVQRCGNPAAFTPMPGFTAVRTDTGPTGSGLNLLLSMEMKIAVGGETGTFPISSGSGSSAASFLHFKPLVAFTGFTVTWGGYTVNTAGTSLNTPITGLPLGGLSLTQMSCIAGSTLEGFASSTPALPYVAPSSFNRVFYKTHTVSPSNNILFSLADTGSFNAIQAVYVTFT